MSEGCLGAESLADGFRQAVRKHPDNVALLGPKVQVSYSELDEITTRLAGALLSQGSGAARPESCSNWATANSFCLRFLLA